MKDIFLTKNSFIVVFIILAALSSIPGVGNIRYIYLIPGIIILFLFRKDIISSLKVNKLLLLFYPFTVWALLTAVWSYNPLLSLQRGLYLFFIVTAGLLSGMLWYKKFSNLLLFLPLNLLVIVASVISFVTGFPADNWLTIDISAFRGFVFHPNNLASLLLFSLLPVLSCTFQHFKKIGEKSKPDFKLYFLLLIIVINFFLIAVTFSRAAILSLIIFVNLAMLIYHLKYLLISYSVLLMLFIISYFLFPSVTDYIHKQFIVKGGYSVLSTRNVLFEHSYTAAKNGEITGLGYGVSDTSIVNTIYSVPETKVREKGNSILALLEETGWIGLILFIFPAFYLIIYGIKNKIKLSTELKYIYLILIALFVHAQFEAWFVGVASFSLLYFFIFFGSLLSGFPLLTKNNNT